VVGELTCSSGSGGEVSRRLRRRLGHLRQTALQEAVGNSGASSCPGSTGVELQSNREGEGWRDDVWEVAAACVSSMQGSGAPFKGRRGGAGGVLER
jgi:hypothetical protein